MCKQKSVSNTNKLISINRLYALKSSNRRLRGKTMTKQSKRTHLYARRTGLANERLLFNLR